nr:MAG: ribosomal protein L44E [Candidatus Nanosalinarum sp. J07AB56]
MVKIPKEQNRYCSDCDTYTEHTVKETTNARASPFKKKDRKRERKINKGYGGFPYEDPAHRSRGRKNPISEKKDLCYTCKDCGTAYKPQNQIRTAKLEIER